MYWNQVGSWGWTSSSSYLSFVGNRVCWYGVPWAPASPPLALPLPPPLLDPIESISTSPSAWNLPFGNPMVASTGQSWIPCLAFALALMSSGEAHESFNKQLLGAIHKLLWDWSWPWTFKEWWLMWKRWSRLITWIRRRPWGSWYVSSLGFYRT